MVTSNTIRFVVLSALLMQTVSITSVIVEWELKKICGKKLLYMGDHHDTPCFASLEKEQLYCFVNELEKYSLTNESPVHIQIEHLSNVDLSNSNENLLTHLIDNLSDKCLKNVTFENSETRAAVGCAEDILRFISRETDCIDGKVNLSLIPPCLKRSSATQSFYLTSVTVEDIKAEYELVIRSLEEKISLIEDNIVKKALLESFSSAKKHYTNLVEYYFNYFEDRNNEPLVDLVQSELDIRPDYIKEFLKDIFEASGSFFELTLFTGIFIHEAPFIITIAGARHISRLNGISTHIPLRFRETIDAKHDLSWSNNTLDEDIPVIQVSDFTFFEKRPEKVAVCSRCILF